jgi:hypothetical protein
MITSKGNVLFLFKKNANEIKQHKRKLWLNGGIYCKDVNFSQPTHQSPKRGFEEKPDKNYSESYLKNKWPSAA